MAAEIPDPSANRKESFQSYFLEIRLSWWVYTTVLICTAESLLVYSDSTNQSLELVRLLFGLALLGFLPGFSTLRLLFSPGDLKLLEVVALSIFLSVVISIGIGVLLGANYSFSSISSVVVIASYTIFATVVATFREYSSFLRKRVI